MVFVSRSTGVRFVPGLIVGTRDLRRRSASRPVKA